MALDDATPSQTQHTTTFRWTSRRKITLRRRKLPTLRLGGKKSGRGLFLLRVLRKVRVRWLKLKYFCILKKLKEYYRNLIKDVIEAGATIEAYQQRLVMEASLAVPVIGFNFYPSLPGSHSHCTRSIFM